MISGHTASALSGCYNLYMVFVTTTSGDYHNCITACNTHLEEVCDKHYVQVQDCVLWKESTKYIILLPKLVFMLRIIIMPIIFSC